MKKHKQKCNVCGARLRGFHTETCDRICARAVKNGVTRWAQIKLDIRYDAIQARQKDELMESAQRARQEALENEYYNQPYLVYA